MKRIIRIKADLSLPPGNTLRDAATGAAPILWRGNAVDVQVGIFDGATVAEITGVSSITLSLRKSQTDSTILAESTTGTLAEITDADAWADGSEQTATLEFTAAQLNIALSGKVSITAWAVLTALTADGARTLAAGAVQVFEDNDAAADPPPENPGTALTLEEGDARYADKAATEAAITALEEQDDQSQADIASLQNRTSAVEDSVSAIMDPDTGKADLVDGKLDPAQLPDLAVSDYLGTVANQAAMLALVGERGDWCVRSDDGRVYILAADAPATLASWVAMSYPAAPVTSVAGKTGAVTLVPADIPGLGDAAAKNTGTTAGTLSAGDDSRIVSGQAFGKTRLSKLARAIFGQATSCQPLVRTLTIGDSWSISPKESLQAQFGTLGSMFPAAQGTLAGGATSAQSTADYSISPTGSYVSLTASGHMVTFGRNGPSVRFEGACFAACVYRTEPGAGSFKLQYQNYAGTWTDFGGTVSADAAAGTATYEATFVGSGTAFETHPILLRVVWVSGAVKILAAGVSLYAGNEYPASMGRGGAIDFDISYAGTRAEQWNTIPQHCWDATLGWLKPDIVFIRERLVTPGVDTPMTPQEWGAQIDTLIGKLRAARKAGKYARLSWHVLSTSGLTLTAVASGVAGEAISLRVVHPGTPNQPISSTVVGNAITLNCTTDGTGAATTTIAQAVAHLSANAAVTALVAVTGSGSYTISACSPVYLGVMDDFDVVITGSHDTGDGGAAADTVADDYMAALCNERGWVFVRPRGHLPAFLTMAASGQMLENIHLSYTGNLIVAGLINSALGLEDLLRRRNYLASPAVQHNLPDGVYGSWKVCFDGVIGVSDLAIYRTDRGSATLYWHDIGLRAYGRITAGIMQNGWALLKDNGASYPMCGTSAGLVIHGLAALPSRAISARTELHGGTWNTPAACISHVAGATTAMLELRTGASHSAAGTLAGGIGADCSAEWDNYKRGSAAPEGAVLGAPGDLYIQASGGSSTIYHKASGGAVTTSVGTQNTATATINVASTTGFAASGTIQIGANTITYTGTTATSFTGCAGGNASATFPAGYRVIQRTNTGWDAK